MQAVEQSAESAGHAATIERAELFYDWLRETSPRSGLRGRVDDGETGPGEAAKETSSSPSSGPTTFAVTPNPD